MSLDKVKASVLEEARAKAEQRSREAKEAAGKLLAEGRAADERDSAEAIREATLRVERDTARERERVLHEGRLKILAAKNQVIDEVFQKVKERVDSFSDAEYAKLLGAWLGALPPEAGGELRVNPGDRERLAGCLDDFNRGRSGAGRFTGPAADPKVASGAVVDGPDYHVDCTIDRRLGELRESAAGDLARKLFGV
ncbi:MAG: V-type ATP synthase subunit E [Planctomycetota bacterium]|jgi:V/A-type H+-transporting ATPase subunit E|nr:V-type ATP synthase subunit E [Planctomycetota bacterium]